MVIVIYLKILKNIYCKLYIINMLDYKILYESCSVSLHKYMSQNV